MSNIFIPDENFLDSDEESYIQTYNEYEDSDDGFDNGYNFDEWN
jgi:hypothetical protein